MTQKSCAVGMRNAILRNHLKQDEENFQQFQQFLFLFLHVTYKLYDNNHVQPLPVYLITRYFLTLHWKGDSLVNEWPGDCVSLTQNHFPKFSLKLLNALP